MFAPCCPPHQRPSPPVRCAWLSAFPTPRRCAPNASSLEARRLASIRVPGASCIPCIVNRRTSIRPAWASVSISGRRISVEDCTTPSCLASLRRSQTRSRWSHPTKSWRHSCPQRKKGPPSGGSMASGRTRFTRVDLVQSSLSLPWVFVDKKNSYRDQQCRIGRTGGGANIR